jgi:hypothetical protein
MELTIADGNHAYCGDLSLSYDSLATQATELGRKLAYMAIDNIAKMKRTNLYLPTTILTRLKDKARRLWDALMWGERGRV